VPKTRTYRFEDFAVKTMPIARTVVRTRWAVHSTGGGVHRGAAVAMDAIWRAPILSATLFFPQPGLRPPILDAARIAEIPAPLRAAGKAIARKMSPLVGQAVTGQTATPGCNLRTTVFPERPRSCPTESGLASTACFFCSRF
jgi:hypothetical protein